MIAIALGHGKFTLVDSADFPVAGASNWHLHGQGYAVNRSGVLLHRAITNAGPDIEVDHRDGNKLNNVRSNLRLTTRTGNARNSSKYGTKRQEQPRGQQRPVRSKYKGVSRVSCKRETWVARIHAGKTYRLGYFHDQVSAARAYDAAAKSLFGEFAKTNFE